MKEKTEGELPPFKALTKDNLPQECPLAFDYFVRCSAKTSNLSEASLDCSNCIEQKYAQSKRGVHNNLRGRGWRHEELSRRPRFNPLRHGFRNFEITTIE